MNVFHEVQRFRQWWIWAVVLTALVAPVIVVLSIAVPPNPDDDEVFVMVFTILLGLLPGILVLSMRLETAIDEEGVHYRFFPVHGKKRTIPWSQIATIHVREYSPIGEYGGWGIRTSLRNGLALNVAGRKGIQLELTNGKRILIGTQQAEEATRIIQQFQRN